MADWQEQSLQMRLSTMEKHYKTSQMLQAAFEKEKMGNK
jgi:hypothetical protein